MKTASLIANSCEAIAILNNSDPVQIEAARDFGKHIGLAFQIQDDRLDFIADAEQLGKVRLQETFDTSVGDFWDRDVRIGKIEFGVGIIRVIGVELDYPF